MLGHQYQPEAQIHGRHRVLSDLFILRGEPEHIRSYHGLEFVAKAVQDWIGAVGAKTALSRTLATSALRSTRW